MLVTSNFYFSNSVSTLTDIISRVTFKLPPANDFYYDKPKILAFVKELQGNIGITCFTLCHTIKTCDAPEEKAV